MARAKRLLGLCLGVACFLSAVLLAQTVTAFKTGEQTTGLTKQCYYEALGSKYTKTVKNIDLCPLSIEVALSPKSPSPAAPPPPPKPSTVTAFKIGEKTTGLTKQCFYSALGNEYTKTVKNIDLCPLNIQVTLK